MNQYTRVFLILLRLAIGWHFLVEGIEKIESIRRGPTDQGRPWSSEVYLREATGPLAPYFRRIPGDPDEMAFARFEVIDAKARPGRDRVSSALATDWQYLFDQFTKTYSLDEQQSGKAQRAFDDSLDRLGKWLAEGKKDVDKTFPSGNVRVAMTTPQRVEEYRARWQQLQDATRQELPAFGQDVWKARLTALKADVRRQRVQLLADLDEQRAELLKTLQGLLTDEQKKTPFTSTAPENKSLQFVDKVTAYGLAAVGACLLLGFLSQLAAVGGAGFLLLFYLAMPPWPGLPDNPRTEGHYLYVNKNLIEMLALFVLASVPTGRWVGLDGLIHWAYQSLIGSPATRTNPDRPS